MNLAYQKVYGETFAKIAVEFSFDGMTYRQINGIVMGSPLGLVLADIFVG